MVLAEIFLSQQDLCPPVYLAGSFTEWQPNIEMEHTIVYRDDQPYHQFRKTLDLPPGEHQYKFKLGSSGDWWITNDNVETICDHGGNINNKIIIEQTKSSADHSTLKSGSIRVQEIRNLSVNSSLRSVKSVPIINSPESSIVHPKSPSSTQELVSEHSTDKPKNQILSHLDGQKDQGGISHDSMPEKRSKVSEFFNRLSCCSSAQ